MGLTVDSLKATVAKKSEDALNKHSDKWLSELLQEGYSAVEKGSAPTDDGKTTMLTPDQADELKEGLDLLTEHKKDFIHLTQVGFTFLVGHWKDKEKAEARRLYLATQATHSERISAFYAAAAGAKDEKDARVAAWNNVEKVLLKLGELGVKILLGMLIAKLGV